MSGRYSVLKALKFPDRLRAISTGEPVAPVHVQLIISDLCNHGCHFCSYRDPTYTSSQLFHVDGNYNPNRKIPTEKVFEIVDDCAQMGVKAIQLTGGGEPTVHPDFAKIVERINESGLAWALVTNGVLAHRYDLGTASWIRVSLDAANADTYSSIRRCPKEHFSRALDTIGLYRAGVGFVVTPENWREIYDASKLVKDCGASSIRIGAQFSEKGEHLFSEFRKDAQCLATLAEELSDDSFEVINRFDEKLSDLNLGSPDYDRCGFQHFTTYIGGDQNIYRCCIYAYNEQGRIGSVKNMRFAQAWKEAYENLMTFDPKSCERCQFNRINRAINEVISHDSNEVFV